MPRANFDTWLRNTFVVSAEDGAFVIAAPTPFAKEWLEKRLAGLIAKTLMGILGRSVQVRFVVMATPDALPLPLETSPQPSNTSPSLGQEGTAYSPDPQTNLNPRYTFDNFIVGNSNRLAHAASLAVARRLTTDYNPLFLYGGVGLGKTHLLHAIGNLAIQGHMTALYVSSETFTNDLITAIREQRTAEFRAKYRTADFLLVDDIQFLAGKEGTQEEFFHTFNTLHEAGKQIVVCADRPPKAIIAMEDRLRSRLEWGLIADIQPPDLETRLAILTAKAQSLRMALPPEVLDLIARKVPNNIRELEGALHRVAAFATLNQQPVTLDLAMTALADLLRRSDKLDPNAVLDAVARSFNVTVAALRGKDRDKDIVLPRQVAMYLLREETSLSLVQIGETLGGRDHSTVLHGCERIANAIEMDDRLRQRIITLREGLRTPTSV